MRYTLRHLRYFVAVAHSGSISAAARSLNVAQPSVSTAINHLEQELGVSLFLRKRSLGVRLTPAGRELEKEARSLLRHLDNFDTAATDIVAGVTGEIHLACFVNVASVYLAAILRSFYDRNPNVTVRCYVGDQAEILSGLESGVYELALTFDFGLRDDLHMDVTCELPPKLLLSEHHPLAAQDKASLIDVISEPFIFLDLPHSKTYFFSLFHALGVQPERTIPVASFETIRTFVGNGLGYSILNLQPRNATNYDGTKVRYMALRENLRPLRLGCLRIRGGAQRRACTAFVEHVHAFFAELPAL